MKRLEPAQMPARGIMETHDFGDSKYYRIACECGNPDDDIQLNIEADDGNTITIHVWSTTKTEWWRRRFDDYDNFLLHWITQRLSDWINRFAVVWTVLRKGYVQSESWTILTRQQALNVAHTLVTAIDDVEKFSQKKRMVNPPPRQL